MSPSYTPRIVVGRTSNALLQRFLSDHRPFDDLDWKKLKENDVEPILQHLQTLEDAEQRQIGVAWRKVHDLADAQGTTVLIAAGRDVGLNIGDELAAKRNAYERAFWCLLEYPHLLDSQRIYAHIYGFSKPCLETRVGFPQGKVIVTAPMLDALRQQIQNLYQKEEQRGDMCKMDHRERDGIQLIHAYPSDYVDDMDSYASNGELTTVSVKPPFHIAFYLDGSAGSVTMLARGGADKREALFEGFSTSILRCPTLPKPEEKTYDLSLFKDPNHELRTEPAHHLMPPRVVAMRLQFLGRPRHRVQFEVDAHDRHDSIYDLLRTKLRGGLNELAKSTILSVVLQATFSLPGQQERIVNFRISTPSWCNLDTDPEGRILRKYLQTWKIEKGGADVARVSPAARVGRR